MLIDWEVDGTDPLRGFEHNLITVQHLHQTVPCPYMERPRQWGRPPQSHCCRAVQEPGPQAPPISLRFPTSPVHGNEH